MINIVIRTLVRIPNIPFSVVFTFFVLMKTKGNKPFKKFLVESLNDKINIDILNLYDKYAKIYYPETATYIIATTFYILLLLWIF